MNPNAQRSMEFIWRRLEEPAELFGVPLQFDPHWWLALAVPLLILALLFVAWTYRKETITIGRRWSAGLAFLRTLTYMTLFFVWLLPALRQVTTSEQQSKVALLFDVSASVTETSDVAPTDTPGEIRLTRQEELLDALVPFSPRSMTGGGISTSPSASDLLKDKDLLKNLLAKNPLVCYRFGEVLDPQAWTIEQNSGTPSSDWRRRLMPELKPSWDELPGNQTIIDLVKFSDDATPSSSPPLEGGAGGGSEPQPGKLKTLAEAYQRSMQERHAVRSRLLNGTNLGLALRELLQKEKGNLQGVILFSDGRQTAGATQDIAEAVALSKKENVPVFAVALGKLQTIPNLRLVDVLAPGRVQPEDDFPVRVVLEGENLQPGQPATVILQVQRPGEQPEDLPQQQVNMTVSSGRQSRAAAEFRIANPKKIKGDWQFKARALPLKGERTRADNVSEAPTIVKVEERKLNVLLFASAASHDYQFVRTLLAREHEKFDVSIYLQSVQNGTVQDIDPKRLLERFPTELRARDADPMNLGNYDVIVAFDPDWQYLVGKEGSTGRTSPQENLKKWVEELGGGLIEIAGPVNTFDLARRTELQAIRDLYPVVFDDSPDALHILDRSNRDAWGLVWDPAAASQPFLDLTDSNNPGRFFEGWDLFFGVESSAEKPVDVPAQRGFFSYFPVKQLKPGAQVLARYADPNRKAQTPHGERQPFFVMSKAGKGPIFYIGSGETYRLRGFSIKFHERFWTKLLRTMGKRESSRGLLVVGSRYSEGETVLVEAELLDNDLRPLAPDPRYPVLLKVIPQADSRGSANQRDVPKEWNEGIPMQAEASKPGAYSARFLVKATGKYGLELIVPGAGEKLTASFTVQASDPERDDVRPDHMSLYRLASQTDGIRLLDETKRSGLIAALQETKDALQDTETKGDESGAASARRSDEQVPVNSTGDLTARRSLEAQRLYFDLRTMPWIAECLDSNIVPFRAEGRVYDLWDKGVTVWQHLDNPDLARGPSWALLLVTILLGAEWLMRKLLRLA